MVTTHSMEQTVRTYALLPFDSILIPLPFEDVNPHFSGVRKVMNTFMDGYYLSRLPTETTVLIHDLACGSGEVTSSLQEWSNSRWPSTSTLPSHLPQKSYLVSFLSRPELKIVASDPYTAQAYYKRTQQHCLPISFSDIAEDGLPSEEEGGEEVYDLVFCSFALHLAGNHLFGLLDQLSRRTRYLVIVAPHKNPHVRLFVLPCMTHMD